MASKIRRSRATYRQEVPISNRVVTIAGWSPGLRALAASRVLPCGCLVGLYETWCGDVIEVIDSAAETCPGHHRVNLVVRRGDTTMRRRTVAAFLFALVLAGGRPAFAQALPAGNFFLDVAFAVERDPTDYYYGTNRGVAVRVGAGMHVSEHNTIRLEIDVPRWRVHDTFYSGPMYCAGPSCVNGDGVVPSRATSNTQVRSVSWSVLYARHLPAIGRVRPALVVGAGEELRRYRSSDVVEQLDPEGHVLRSDTAQSDRTKYWPAIVVGADAEVALTARVAVMPQFRFHTFPYPRVAIARAGIGVRWRF